MQINDKRHSSVLGTRRMEWIFCPCLLYACLHFAQPHSNWEECLWCNCKLLLLLLTCWFNYITILSFPVYLFFYIYSSNTAQYEEENQSVRMYLRGRPVVLYVPEKRADSLNYDITKVQPAPSKKLKLDWVRD